MIEVHVQYLVIAIFIQPQDWLKESTRQHTIQKHHGEGRYGWKNSRLIMEVGKGLLGLGL